MNYSETLKQLPDIELYYDKEVKISISYRYRKKQNTIPILFLHGFNGNSKSWAYQFRFFDDKQSTDWHLDNFLPTSSYHEGLKHLR